MYLFSDIFINALRFYSAWLPCTYQRIEQRIQHQVAFGVLPQDICK